MMKFASLRWVAAIAACASLAQAAPSTIDDAALRRMMCDGLGEIADRGKAMDGATLAQHIRDSPATTELDLPRGSKRPLSYDAFTKSVYLIGSVYDCGKCDNWHLSGVATAWSLTEDGVMVTNHHVFADAKGDSWGVCGADGKVHPITAVLAADPVADVAIFRVDPGDERLTPLALAADAPVGTKVRILSHPSGRFFFQTSGEVARYSTTPSRRDQPAKTWMSVTADYAKGSSGAPVVNRRGNVVGIVSNTQSIYYGSRDPNKKDEQGPLQMVVKNCVPVAALRALVKEPEVVRATPEVESPSPVDQPS